MFQPLCINDGIFIMRNNCQKVPHGCLNVPPNGAHFNRSHLDILLFIVIRMTSITNFLPIQFSAINFTSSNVYSQVSLLISLPLKMKDEINVQQCPSSLYIFNTTH
jgi:hypothetical protein